jgi:hypothetical protein
MSTAFGMPARALLDIEQDCLAAMTIEKQGQHHACRTAADDRHFGGVFTGRSHSGLMPAACIT